MRKRNHQKCVHPRHGRRGCGRDMRKKLDAMPHLMLIRLTKTKEPDSDREAGNRFCLHTEPVADLPLWPFWPQRWPSVGPEPQVCPWRQAFVTVMFRFSCPVTIRSRMFAEALGCATAPGIDDESDTSGDRGPGRKCLPEDR